MPGPGSQIHRVGWSGARSRVGRIFFFFVFVLQETGLQCCVLQCRLGFSFGGSEKERQHGRRECLVGKHAELAASNHGGGQVHHEWVGLEMEVTQHFVGAPAADQFDDVGVNLAAEESHSSPCT